ncbi:non-specific serine/threonine protein kinase [Ranunculus cassubicifolius]
MAEQEDSIKLLQSFKENLAKLKKQLDAAIDNQNNKKVVAEEEQSKKTLVVKQEEEERLKSVSCSVSGLKRKLGCCKAIRIKDINKDYICGDLLGKGTYGYVRRCRSRSNGVVYACKSVLKGEFSDSVHQEIDMMRHLSGDSKVVNLISVYEDDKSYHLVMDLCSGGDLFKEIQKQGGKYPEHKAAAVINELMTLIQYCHQMGVAHRDIKPENVLLTAEGDMVLADFGFAARYSHVRGKLLFGDAGTPCYMAPEIVTMGNFYSEKVDVWSAGVILHSLLVGELPFDGDTLEEKFHQIEHAALNFDVGAWKSVSPLARDLIKKMLVRDPSSRLTADEVLQHPWFSLHAEEEQTTPPPSSEEQSNLPQSQEEVVRELIAAVSRINISQPGGVERKTKPEAKRCRLWDPRLVIQQPYRFSSPCAAF